MKRLNGEKEFERGIKLLEKLKEVEAGRERWRD